MTSKTNETWIRMHFFLLLLFSIDSAVKALESLSITLPEVSGDPMKSRSLMRSKSWTAADACLDSNELDQINSPSPIRLSEDGSPDRSQQEVVQFDTPSTPGQGHDDIEEQGKLIEGQVAQGDIPSKGVSEVDSGVAYVTRRRTLQGARLRMKSSEEVQGTASNRLSRGPRAWRRIKEEEAQANGAVPGKRQSNNPKTPSSRGPNHSGTGTPTRHSSGPNQLVAVTSGSDLGFAPQNGMLLPDPNSGLYLGTVTLPGPQSHSFSSIYPTPELVGFDSHVAGPHLLGNPLVLSNPSRDEAYHYLETRLSTHMTAPSAPPVHPHWHETLISIPSMQVHPVLFDSHGIPLTGHHPGFAGPAHPGLDEYSPLTYNIAYAPQDGSSFEVPVNQETRGPSSFPSVQLKASADAYVPLKHRNLESDSEVNGEPEVGPEEALKVPAGEVEKLQRGESEWEGNSHGEWNTKGSEHLKQLLRIKGDGPSRNVPETLMPGQDEAHQGAEINESKNQQHSVNEIGSLSDKSTALDTAHVSSSMSHSSTVEMTSKEELEAPSMAISHDASKRPPSEAVPAPKSSTVTGEASETKNTKVSTTLVKEKKRDEKPRQEKLSRKNLPLKAQEKIIQTTIRINKGSLTAATVKEQGEKEILAGAIPSNPLDKLKERVVEDIKNRDSQGDVSVTSEDRESKGIDSRFPPLAKKLENRENKNQIMNGETSKQEEEVNHNPVSSIILEKASRNRDMKLQVSLADLAMKQSLQKSTVKKKLILKGEFTKNSEKKIVYDYVTENPNNYLSNSELLKGSSVLNNIDSREGKKLEGISRKMSEIDDAWIEDSTAKKPKQTIKPREKADKEEAKTPPEVGKQKGERVEAIDQFESVNKPPGAPEKNILTETLTKNQQAQRITRKNSETKVSSSRVQKLVPSDSLNQISDWESLKTNGQLQENPIIEVGNAQGSKEDLVVNNLSEGSKALNHLDLKRIIAETPNEKYKDDMRLISPGKSSGKIRENSHKKVVALRPSPVEHHGVKINDRLNDYGSPKYFANLVTKQNSLSTSSIKELETEFNIGGNQPKILDIESSADILTLEETFSDVKGLPIHSDEINSPAKALTKNLEDHYGKELAEEWIKNKLDLRLIKSLANCLRIDIKSEHQELQELPPNMIQKLRDFWNEDKANYSRAEDYLRRNLGPFEGTRRVLAVRKQIFQDTLYLQARLKVKIESSLQTIELPSLAWLGATSNSELLRNNAKLYEEFLIIPKKNLEEIFSKKEVERRYKLMTYLSHRPNPYKWWAMGNLWSTFHEDIVCYGLEVLKILKVGDALQFGSKFILDGGAGRLTSIDSFLILLEVMEVEDTTLPWIESAEKAWLMNNTPNNQYQTRIEEFKTLLAKNDAELVKRMIQNTDQKRRVESVIGRELLAKRWWKLSDVISWCDRGLIPRKMITVGNELKLNNIKQFQPRDKVKIINAAIQRKLKSLNSPKKESEREAIINWFTERSREEPDQPQGILNFSLLKLYQTVDYGHGSIRRFWRRLENPLNLLEE